MTIATIDLPAETLSDIIWACKGRIEELIDRASSTVNAETRAECVEEKNRLLDAVSRMKLVGG